METNISNFTIESYDRVLNLWKQCEGIGMSDSDSRDGFTENSLGSIQNLGG